MTYYFMKSKLSLLLALSLFLVGCLPNSNLWGYTLNSTPIPTQTFVHTQTANSPTGTMQTPPPTVTVIPTSIPPTEPPRHAERVLIVSFDGLRPDAIAKAPMNNLLALMQNGAYSLTAQTIFPSVTLPAHASMLVGVCPHRHHVIWDEYLPVNGYARGVDIFDVAHAAGLRTVMIVGKEKLRQVTEPESTDVFEDIEYEKDVPPENAIAKRASLEVQNGFGLMFIHFPTGDIIGHQEGWMSKPQLSAYRDGDAALGKLLDALDANNLRDSTLIIVTADHGGHDKTHGTNSPEDMTIPWIVSGPGIQAMQLSTQVYTMDTAATAAYALGLSIPDEWQGMPITEAFGLAMEPSVEAACR
jgi:predicted AlkP superfamily pyrophosphatase or phosphodiesterase